MINLFEEFEKLLKEAPLPYGRKPVLKEYSKDGNYQEFYIPCSPRSMISIHMHFDGVQIRCYAYVNKQWYVYQLGTILYDRVPKPKYGIAKPPDIEKPTNPDNFDAQRLYGIKCVHYSLLLYGDDVLRGDLEWIKESRYPPLPAGDMTFFMEKYNITF